MSSGKFDLEGIFDLEIYNINTNLNNWIQKYTTISNSFKKTIKIQNEKLNNNEELTDDKFIKNLERYKFMKFYQPMILNIINEIKTNLVTLDTLVLDTNNLAEQYIEIFENRYINELANKLDNLNFNNINIGGKKPKKHLRSRRVRKRKSMKQKKHNKKYIDDDDDENV